MVSSSTLLKDLASDLRFAARQIRRSPFFAATIIATFALGIAANTATFSVMDGIVLRPLAVPQLERVVTVGEQRGPGSSQTLSYADYQDYLLQNQAFSQLAAQTHTSPTLTLGGQSEHVQATRSTSNLFELFRIQPLLGRTFAAEENQPGRDGEVVLTHAFWQSHFGSREDAVGKDVVLDGRPYAIVGIMPRSFDHVGFTDMWLPLALNPQQQSDRKARGYSVLGRLRNGVTVTAASDQLNALAARNAQRYPLTNRGWSVRVRPLTDSINGDLTPIFTRIILAATLLLMLVVCANISNLQFARTMRRAPEMAVRSALGSSRYRILRQLLVESLLQSILGALGGILLARLALHYLLAAMPAQVSRFLAGWSDIHLSIRTLAYSIAVAVAAGLIAGIAPALTGMRVDLLEQLKLGSRSVSGSACSHKLRNIFAGIQIMLATALLAAAACIAASMYSMLHAAAQFAPAQALTFDAYLPASRYATTVQQAAFLHDSLDHLRALPGMNSAEFTTALPYNNTGVWWQDLAIVGDPPPLGLSRSTQRITVSSGYLRSFGIPLVRGRSFSPADSMDAPRVALISRQLARQYFGSRDPIGQQIRLGRDADLSAPATIVGVVGDVIYTWVDQVPQPAVYLSSTQFPSSTGTYVLRAPGDPMALASTARRTLAALDSSVPVEPAKTYERFLHESLIGLWYVAVMIGVDAGIALLLCALGIFGVMANMVTERTHEIGIRFAVGADRSAIMRLLLGRSLLVTSTGLVAGLMLALEVGRVLTSILEGVRSLQPLILIASALVVMLISIVAGYVPARRASAVDPVQALRME